MQEGLYYLDLDTKSEPDRARLLGTYYEQIYRVAFPKSDQAEGPEVWLPLMGSRPRSGQPSIHAILAIGDMGTVIGGILFENYRISASWLATYIAVAPPFQGKGVAKGLFSAMRHKIADQDGSRYILLAETENPVRIPPDERADAEIRLRILDRLGLGRVPIDYVQPALSSEKQAPEDLMLLCHHSTTDAGSICADRIACFLREFFSALDQAESPHIARMCRALAAEKRMMLERLA